ncbi:alpha,alpha-trehalose-phosphate synthase (UDP-forming) [Psychrobacter alimentarius]|uniref:alpha,alpha-trehalose-phosphate synthase (UDP-forming) n=1 Tax=Psychrobacter alimentarius TaxID=261164 RepID=UPI003FD14CB7
MSRLIVLSNRVKVPDNKPMAGGLAVALQNVLIGSSVVWMGWNGKVVENSSHDSDSTNSFSNKQTNLTGEDTCITYMTTALTTEQYKQFYCGFANNVLWPLLHERVDLISQKSQDYAGYQEVNRLFAKQLKEIIKPDDVIWVHDYHFLSMAYHCRQLGIFNRIGFFLHIPFTSLQFWKTLEQSREIIHHLAHYNLVGTQTQKDRTNCLNVLQYYLKDRFIKDHFVANTPINVLDMKRNFFKPSLYTGTKMRVDLALKPQHSLMVDTYPIGVNVARIQEQVSQLSLEASLDSTNSSQNKAHAFQQIIAVDRIDYSKGLLKRFAAYRDFLAQNPSYQNHLQLLQVACPSRLDLPTYQNLYNNVKKMVYDINQQKLSEDSAWQAINYKETALSHEKLMTMFRQSDVGWVNSLKDGMNLVAKEYIAAQDPDDPGVLLLSRYAGAAEQMHAAVSIDPHQPKSMIEGLKSALMMPLKERQYRYQMLLQGLQQDDLQSWQQRFLSDLSDRKCSEAHSLKTVSTQMSDFSS